METRLGISSWCYPYAIGVAGHEPKYKLNAFDLVDKAVKLQVPVVQIADNYPLHQHSEEELEKLYKYAFEKGIDIEVGTRGIKTENLLRYIHICEILHSPLLRVVIDEPGDEPDIDEIIRRFRSVLSLLEEKKIVIGIENHDRLSAKTFAEIVETMNSPWIGIVLDTVNSFACEEGTELVLNTLAPYTVCFHMKDYRIDRVSTNMGLEVYGTIAGEGRLNLPRCLQILRKRAKSDFSTILEFWMQPENTPEKTVRKEEEWVEKSITYMKSVENILE